MEKRKAVKLPDLATCRLWAPDKRDPASSRHVFEHALMQVRSASKMNIACNKHLPNQLKQPAAAAVAAAGFVPFASSMKPLKASVVGLPPRHRPSEPGIPFHLGGSRRVFRGGGVMRCQSYREEATSAGSAAVSAPRIKAICKVLTHIKRCRVTCCLATAGPGVAASGKY